MCQWGGYQNYEKEKGNKMANNILFGNCDKHIIKVRVQELNRGPQGVPGPAGRDGVVQYTAGNGIEISDENVISATGTGAVWGAITGVLSNQADLNTALSTKASNSAVQSAQNTANQAVTTANAVNTAITALNNYLNLSVFNTYNGSQFAVISGTGTPAGTTELYVARNAGGTLGKVYGALQIDNASAGSTTVKLNLNTGFVPTEQITIIGAGFCTSVDGTIANANLVLNTDGTIEISGYHTTSTFYFRMIACLLFVQNFGDEPQE